MTKIFLIEKDITSASRLEAKLSLVGFKTGRPSGLQDLSLLLSEIISFQPDYIVVEPASPAFEEIGIIRVIKEEERLKDIPVFVYSGQDKKDSLWKKWEQMADYCFSKDDMDAEAFAEKLKKISGNKKYKK